MDSHLAIKMTPTEPLKEDEKAQLLATIEALQEDNNELRVKCVETQIAFNMAMASGAQELIPHLQTQLTVLRQKLKGNKNGG